MFNPFIVSSSLHVFTILSKHFQMVPSHVGLVEGGVLNVCSDSPCECTQMAHSSTIANNDQKDMHKHCIGSRSCVSVWPKKGEWPEGSLPRFNFVSQCLTPSRGRLSQGMVSWWLQDFLGPISILGSPYAMLFYYFGRNYTRFPADLPAGQYCTWISTNKCNSVLKFSASKSKQQAQELSASAQRPPCRSSVVCRLQGIKLGKNKQLQSRCGK